MESLLESEALLDVLILRNKSRQGSVFKAVAVQLLETALGGEELHDAAQTILIHLGRGRHLLDGNGTIKRHNRKVLEAQRNLPSSKIMVAAAKRPDPLKRARGQHAQVTSCLVQVISNGIVVIVFGVLRGRGRKVGLLEAVLLKVTHESLGLLESFTRCCEEQ